MESTKPKRFQFSIIDLLLIAAVTFLGLVLTPFVKEDLGHCFAAVATTLCAAFAGLWVACRCEIVGLRRVVAMVGCVIAGWISVWIVLCIFAKPRMADWDDPHPAVWSCRSFVEAQEIYRLKDYDGDGVLEYAQSISGNNSLYETKAGAGDLALVPKSLAEAEGLPGQAIPKNGCVFKVLKWQGPHAPGGQKSYRPWDPKTQRFSPHMTDGYALVASPAFYDDTGRWTFTISNYGVVYECDLGPDTAKIVEQMVQFDPDPAQGWRPSKRQR